MTTIKTLLAVLILFNFSCKKETLQNLTAANTQSEDKSVSQTAAHYIGERFGGGIIFWIDRTGEHGLIADTVNLPLVKWGGNIITGATSTNIGSGYKNTRKIIEANGRQKIYAAFEVVRSTRDGYKDWFLPSKDELHEMYLHQIILGFFSLNDYWSSSEIDYRTAWSEDLIHGIQSIKGKVPAGSCNLRAVRAF